MTPTLDARPKKRTKLTQRPVASWPLYMGARTMVASANVAGIEPSMRLMRALGGRWASMPFNAQRLERAIENIRWCFPDWPPERVHECAVEAYRHLFALATELALAPRLLNQDGYADHVELGNLGEAVRAISADSPCILITGHCGNWELLGYTLALLGFPMHALYRPLDVRPLDEWVYATRRRRGLMLIDKFGASRALPELLQQNGSVGFIADQNAGIRGTFVPFFDRLASSYKAIGVLAARFNAPIVCGHARRLSGFPSEAMKAAHAGDLEAALAFARESQLFKYHLDVLDIIRPEDWHDQPDPIFYITARYRRAIEMMVERSPEQYLWMHRYWKTAPPHERAGRPFPPALREKIAALPWMTGERLERVVARSEDDARLRQTTH